jgi:dihydroneopterin aldolase
VRKGVVDLALPDYLDDTPLFIAGPSSLPHAAALLAERVTPGAAIATVPTRKSA